MFPSRRCTIARSNDESCVDQNQELSQKSASTNASKPFGWLVETHLVTFSLFLKGWGCKAPSHRMEKFPLISLFTLTSLLLNLDALK